MAWVSGNDRVELEEVEEEEEDEEEDITWRTIDSDECRKREKQSTRTIYFDFYRYNSRTNM
jgi:hypothetical protein